MITVLVYTTEAAISERGLANVLTTAQFAVGVTLSVIRLNEKQISRINLPQ